MINQNEFSYAIKELGIGKLLCKSSITKNYFCTKPKQKANAYVFYAPILCFQILKSYVFTEIDDPLNVSSRYPIFYEAWHVVSVS